MPEYFDLAADDGPNSSRGQLLDLLQSRLEQEGLEFGDLPPTDSCTFSRVLVELGFGSALEQIKLGKLVWELQSRGGVLVAGAAAATSENSCLVEAAPGEPVCPPAAATSPGSCCSGAALPGAGTPATDQGAGPGCGPSCRPPSRAGKARCPGALLATAAAAAAIQAQDEMRRRVLQERTVPQDPACTAAAKPFTMTETPPRQEPGKAANRPLRSVQGEVARAQEEAMHNVRSASLKGHPVLERSRRPRTEGAGPRGGSAHPRAPESRNPGQASGFPATPRCSTTQTRPSSPHLAAGRADGQPDLDELCANKLWYMRRAFLLDDLYATPSPMGRRRCR